jgi:outer membrane protein W
VAVEGIYSTGEFTSYEGRLIAKIDRSQKVSFYGGIGYIQVTTEKDIIGVATRFSDSGVSGVVGVEAALGDKVLLHVEVSAARIELEQTVTSGAQTVKASVKYAPVTIGIGLVLMVF